MNKLTETDIRKNGKKVVVVGAGPGGLTAAMLLCAKGFDVTVYEKENQVGGRNAPLSLGRNNEYVFDTGPTFLMMTPILREMFDATGRRLEDYCKVVPLDPMYRLSFPDGKVMDITPDQNRMEAQISRNFPGNEGALKQFMKREGVRFEKMYPCLQKDYSSWTSMVSKPLLKALPHLALGKTLFENLGGYFKDEYLKMCFTFQAKYLGMSPWECPAAFTIIPFIEHHYGIDHVEGGLSEISEAMKRVVCELGGRIELGKGVRKVITGGRRAKGIVLNDGTEVMADAVVLNADFGHAMTTLFDPGVIRKYNVDRLEKKKFSCSTFMLYLAVDKLYDEPHHHVVFADNYRANIEDIARHKRLSQDMSIYVRNASVTDPKLAPKGHSALYVLVPVANQFSGIDWSEALVKQYRDAVITRIEQKTSMKDLSKHITAEIIISPKDWESRAVYRGATFNLGHTVDQMLYLRPRNRFEEVKHCYLVGGGTHPGSGLPTIYESARISAGLVCQDLGI
jgi:phytoene desaturase